MTPSAPEIRRRLNESLARLASKTKVYEDAVRDHVLEVETLKAECPHDQTSDFVGTYTHERTCSTCGKTWEL